MAEGPDLTKSRVLPDVSKLDTPIAVPVKNFSYVEQNTNIQINKLDGQRDSKKIQILSDVKTSAHLKRMDIVQDSLFYVETTELIDGIFQQQKDGYIQIVEYMLAIVAEQYVPKKEYNKLAKRLKEFEAKYMSEDNESKEEILKKRFTNKLEDELAKGVTPQRLNGIRISFFRDIQSDMTTNDDKKKELMAMASKLVSEYIEKVKHGMESTEEILPAKDPDNL